VVAIKRYWGYLVGILPQLFMFVIAWFLWSSFQEYIEVFDSVVIKYKTYHLVQVKGLGWGSIYLFDCEEDICNFSKIASIDSTFYSRGQITYTPSNNTLYIEARVHGDNEEYIIPLNEN